MPFEHFVSVWSKHFDTPPGRAINPSIPVRLFVPNSQLGFIQLYLQHTTDTVWISLITSQFQPCCTMHHRSFHQHYSNQSHWLAEQKPTKWVVHQPIEFWEKSRTPLHIHLIRPILALSGPIIQLHCLPSQQPSTGDWNAKETAQWTCPECLYGTIRQAPCTFPWLEWQSRSSMPEGTR